MRRLFNIPCAVLYVAGVQTDQTATQWKPIIEFQMTKTQLPDVRDVTDELRAVALTI
jgi:hypothetical protein